MDDLSVLGRAIEEQLSAAARSDLARPLSEAEYAEGLGHDFPRGEPRATLVAAEVVLLLRHFQTESLVTGRSGDVPLAYLVMRVVEHAGISQETATEVWCLPLLGVAHNA